MLYYCFLALVLICCTATAGAQERKDGSFEFQGDPAKKYSLYIPSGYDAEMPSALMLGLHPLNPARWNGVSWCDTLTAFAEQNNLILICPDGGSDGRIDDPIDTAFTTALLDSVMQWYSVDGNRIYAMGFSWGGRTTYTYGLSHVERFGGFMPIGAAINGTVEVTPALQKAAAGKPFYLIHGDLDAPSQRFYPVKEGLENSGAILNSLLLPGVGHTIDFDDRNDILRTAFRWIDSVNLALTTSGVEHSGKTNESFLYPVPNPVRSGAPIRLRGNAPEEPGAEVYLHDLTGREIPMRLVQTPDGMAVLPLHDLAPGAYLVRVVRNEQERASTMVMVAE